MPIPLMCARRGEDTDEASNIWTAPPGWANRAPTESCVTKPTAMEPSDRRTCRSSPLFQALQILRGNLEIAQDDPFGKFLSQRCDDAEMVVPGDLEELDIRI